MVIILFVKNYLWAIFSYFIISVKGADATTLAIAIATPTTAIWSMSKDEL